MLKLENLQNLSFVPTHFQLQNKQNVVYALKDKACLNKISEFVSSCRHIKNRFRNLTNFIIVYIYLISNLYPTFILFDFISMLFKFIFKS